MSFRVQGMSNLRAHDALLDALLVSFGEDQPLHEDPGCVHMVGIDRPRGEQFLDFGDRHAARCRHHRIEIARGLAVDEIALVVAAPRLDDGEIGGQPRLENIALAAEDFFLFAFGDDRADARARIEADDARAAGAQPLGERALRIEFELEKAGQILPLEFLLLPDIRSEEHTSELQSLMRSSYAVFGLKQKIAKYRA